MSRFDKPFQETCEPTRTQISILCGMLARVPDDAELARWIQQKTEDLAELKAKMYADIAECLYQGEKMKNTKYYADDDRCAEFRMDPKKVEAIARRISKAAMEAKILGLKVFGGSGSGTLRIFGKGTSGTVARLDGVFDGGDGGDDY